MTHKTLEERIEAAAKALGIVRSWDEISNGERASRRATARQVLAASFPELFTDPPQAWLAPSEPTKEMTVAGRDALEDCREFDALDGGEFIRAGAAEQIYAAMRSAFLNTKEG